MTPKLCELVVAAVAAWREARIHGQALDGARRAFEVLDEQQRVLAGKAEEAQRKLNRAIMEEALR